jgi:drug/metabolite transporter (DMT)-like permease
MMPSVFEQLRIIALTSATMVAFAANSLLCRAALRGGAIDAATFTAIRLVSGALVLVAITQARRGADPARSAGSWRAAAALAVYAIAFSLAYLRLAASTGALILFGAAQLTMITGGLLRGERPTLRQWIGYAIAATGLVLLNLPSLEAPPPEGAALMLAAGITWGLYSLFGRAATRPLAANAGNFLRSVPMAGGFAVIAMVVSMHVTAYGVVLAIASGAVTSGLGYCVWYLVLPSLGAARGAIVQLSVPVIAAVGGIVLLGEPLHRHVVVGGSVILGGLALALWRPLGPRRAAAAVHTPDVAQRGDACDPPHTTPR